MPMKTKYLDEKSMALRDHREKLLIRFTTAARSSRNTSRVCAEIRRTNEFLSTLDRIAEENAPRADDRKRFAVSSWFLHECFKKLTADQDEQFFFVTGAEVDGIMVLDQIGEIAHQKRSRMGVVADIPSTHNLLIRLEEFGHRFLAHFHSHPGNGPESTIPSGIDENFQRRLEKGGHLAVMAIFSRDGYIRFARMDGNFEIAIFGEGVKAYAPGVYRLTKVG